MIYVSIDKGKFQYFLDDITEENMMRLEKRIYGITHEVELTCQWKFDRIMIYSFGMFMIILIVANSYYIL